MGCSHPNIDIIKERAFMGAVVDARDENRAAHGNVTFTERCRECGSFRRRNVNGRHEEVGAWGGPSTVFPPGERPVTGLVPEPPEPLEMRHHDGRTATISVDERGMIVIPDGGPDAELIPQEWLQAAMEYRRALIRTGRG